MKKLICLLLVTSSSLLANTDLQQFKAQVDGQQLTINKLIKKIEKLENTTHNTAQDKSGTFEQSKFIPDISMIFDISYVSRNKKDDEVAHLEVPGVAHGLLGSHTDGGGVTHSTYNAQNGFNFNYAELAFSSSVDPFFTMDAILHLGENSFEVEEIFFTSTALGYGIKTKGGKFLSNFGYLNEKHHHSWSFSDMPLVYESFLGLHGINENGLQLQWIAPTDTYLMIGGEILQGENKQMFGNDTIGTIAEASDAPSLFVVYAKSSIDIDNTTIYSGISYASGSSRLNHLADESPNIFSGDSTLYGVDLVIKHYFDSYTFLSWQSEWMMRDMNGQKYFVDSDDSSVIDKTTNLTKQQAGIYTQLEYGINLNWLMAVRYDSIYKNDVISNGINLNKPTSLDKYSAMIEYRTSEFAKFRLQYNHNEALFSEDGLRQKINSIIFQANIAIGAHSAHSF